MLKALHAGLRLDTRCVMVGPVDEDAAECSANTWRPLRVNDANGQIFHGSWHHTGNLLRTMVAAPPPVPPILLKIPGGHA